MNALLKLICLRSIFIFVGRIAAVVLVRNVDVDFINFFLVLITELPNISK